MKRAFDITFSLIALLVFSIPIVFFSILLLFREKHAVLFKQQRIGKKKRPFTILKFQTMVNEVPTKTGRVLRRTGLDEVPQFINVLKGDMSIVGPRALTMNDIMRLGWDDEFHSARWNVKPGITGFAQIYGGQNKKTSWFWDRKYAKVGHLAIDLLVIIISFAMNLFGKTRVRNMIWPNKKLK